MDIIHEKMKPGAFSPGIYDCYTNRQYHEHEGFWGGYGRDVLQFGLAAVAIHHEAFDDGGGRLSRADSRKVLRHDVKRALHRRSRVVDYLAGIA